MRAAGPSTDDGTSSGASTRSAMDAALKAVVVTELRRRGFTGSLPHLRRRHDDRVDALSVQHFSSGGSFVVEVASCGPSGVTTSWGLHIPPGKVRAIDCHPPRPRLGAAGFPRSGDHWYVYGPRSYDDEAASWAAPARHYEAVAQQVLDAIEEQAEGFWRDQHHRGEVEPW